MNTTLDLRPLTEPQRLAAINECVATTCAGWKWTKENRRALHRPAGYFDAPNDGVRVLKWKTGGYSGDGLPPFATSADAILTLLENQPEISNVFERGQWFVGIARSKSHADFFSATASTLPIAACLALLRSHGVEVIQ